VGGVIERPYGLGDLIHERGRIGDKDFEVTWKVVEHVRPSKIVLQAQGAPTRITYTFTPGKETTVFTRKLEYQADNLASVKELEKIMRDNHSKVSINARQTILFNDADRELFLQTLAHVVSCYNWIYHAYCSMANHYYLLVDTPDPRISDAV
jgi:hypothetical protein